MNVLLLSTYELGRQPFGLASPAAGLRRAGATVACLDLTRQRFDDAAARAADLVGVYLPMHTATRLALPVIDRVRALNPGAHLCCYGLYARLNEALLRSRGVGTVLAGEFEGELVELAARLGRAREAGAGTSGGAAAPGAHAVPRLAFVAPDRSGLPPLDRYATLQMPDGERRIVGYTEASRGCKHFCRHCPVVPIYQGQFRIVPPEVVLEDIRAQVALGARHITFGDPDFFNGIGHAMRIVKALAAACPGVTYDVTVKVEHLLKHASCLPTLRETGCLFVTSAAESLDDTVLGKLQKGHTRADFLRVVEWCRGAGLTLSPTFVAFTPWTTLEGYGDLLRTIESLGLIEQVAPIQLAIRLLVPERSRLLELPEIRAVLDDFDPERLAYPWRHADPRVDRLQQDVMRLAGIRLNAPRSETFETIRSIAHRHAGVDPPLAEATRARRDRSTVPYLNEPWYC
jgi:radical SAM superfamily enzyme YgiQ (UPF0313 family)